MKTISGVRYRTVKGNLVKIEDGPAAVTGDESCQKSLSDSGYKWKKTGRRMKRMIRKSEDLPEKPACSLLNLLSLLPSWIIGSSMM